MSTEDTPYAKLDLAPPVALRDAAGTRSAMALLLLAGCSNDPVSVVPPPSLPGPVPTPQVPAPLPPVNPEGPGFDQPVRCAADTDCPNLACGPCTDGQTVTERYRSVECARNPCPGTTSACRGGVCVAVAAPMPPAPPPAPHRGVVRCESDDDCPRGCGPCQPGIVSDRFANINCARNPCPGVVPVCRDHVCVVR